MVYYLQAVLPNYSSMYINKSNNITTLQIPLVLDIKLSIEYKEIGLERERNNIRLRDWIFIV